MRRAPRPPVQLNLKNPAPKHNETKPSVIRNFSTTEYKPRSTNPALTGDSTVEQATNPSIRFADSKSATSEEKTLNVLFNWNGHTWDAYEVLGIPAGSSRAAVDAAFERIKLDVDQESVPFVTAAYRAISRD